MSPWPALSFVYILWGGSEALLALRRRASPGQARVDEQSFRILVVTIFLVVLLGPGVRFLGVGLIGWHRDGLAWLGGGMILTGMAIRWAAIRTLGRFFTVEVSVAADHRVVDTGLYRWVRHPAYSGAVVSMLGFPLALGSWAVLLVQVPFALALAYRIRVEEAALLEALGEQYRAYMARTRRLVPFLY